MNLNDPVAEAISAVPGRAAFIVDDRVLTYAGLGGQIDVASASLNAANVRAGDRVALASRTSAFATATVLACAKIGAAAAPMSAASTVAEIATLAAAAGCGPVGVASAETAERMRDALGEMPLTEEILAIDRAPAQATEVRADDVAVILFTSGTTGVPKPIALTHEVLTRRVRSFAAPVDPSADPNVAIVCVPFHHVAGLIGVLVGLAGGSTAVLQPRFDAGEWLRLVERHRVQRAFLVPAMLHRILDHPALETTDLGSLQMITYGAAPAARALVEHAADAMPHVAFINVFGQTETLGAVTVLGPDDHRAGKAGSVGRPMPGVEIRIVNPSTGDEVADGDTGEFWVRAPHTTTAGWVRSGDLVRRDAEGYLYAVGRLSDIINRGGEKIDPAEVEAVLLAHPSVAAVAVCGIPDAELGERVGAVIVAREAVDPKALRMWCRERLAAYKVPAVVSFVDEIPLTELGKVSRKVLRSVLDPDVA
jgi:long-chain acyl-CoA synthetase